MKFLVILAPLFFMINLVGFAQTTNKNIFNDNNVIMGTDQLYLTGTVFLEGPYLGNGKMSNELQKNNLLDVFKFDEKNPFVFVGSSRLLKMSLGAEPPIGTVDVLKFVLRTKSDPYSVVDSAFAWLMEDGTIREYEKGIKTFVIFNIVNANTYFVEVRHRNHLPIISNDPYLFRDKTLVNIDFTNPKLLQGKGNESFKISNTGGVALMVAGDLYKNSLVRETNAHDSFSMIKALRETSPTNKIYSVADLNMNSLVDIEDKKILDENSKKLYFFPLPNE